MTKKLRELSPRARDRMQSEVSNDGGEAYEAFKAAHGGMTPLEFAQSMFPAPRRKRPKKR
jgi:hypothetical protein